MANIRPPASLGGGPAGGPVISGVPTRTDLLVPPQTETPEDRTLIKMRLRRLYILRMIRTYGTISRAEIGRRCSYNPQSTKRIVDELVAEGLVMEEGKIQKPVGRSPIACRLNELAAVLIGASLHGTRMDAVLMDLAGEVRFSRSEDLGAGKGDLERAAQISSFLADLYKSSNLPQKPPLCGIAVGLAETEPLEGADFLRMPILWGPTLGGLTSQQISRDLDLPTLVSSHVRMRALGSLWFGLGQRYSSFAYIHLGEKTDMAHLVRGRIQQGATGRGGAFSLLLGPDPAAAGAELRKKKTPTRLARALSTVINLLNPAAVIISTDDGPPEPEEIERLRRALRDDVPEEVLIRTPTVPCDLPPNGTVLGSAACVLHHIFSLTYVSVEDVL